MHREIEEKRASRNGFSTPTPFCMITTGPVAALSLSSRAIALFAYALVAITIVPLRLVSLDREIASIGALMRFAPLRTVTVTVLLGTSLRLVRTATTVLPAFVRYAANGKPIAPEPRINIFSFEPMCTSQRYIGTSGPPLRLFRGKWR